jgi:hypothetical protein
VFSAEGAFLPFSHALTVNQLTPNAFANRYFVHPFLTLAAFSASWKPFFATRRRLMPVFTSCGGMISFQYFILHLAPCKDLRQGQKCGFSPPVLGNLRGETP